MLPDKPPFRANPFPTHESHIIMVLSTLNGFGRSGKEREICQELAGVLWSLSFHHGQSNNTDSDLISNSIKSEMHEEGIRRTAETDGLLLLESGHYRTEFLACDETQEPIWQTAPGVLCKLITEVIINAEAE